MSRSNRNTWRCPARKRQNRAEAAAAYAERLKRIGRLEPFKYQMAESTRIETLAPEQLLTNWQRKHWAKAGYPALSDATVAGKYLNMQKR